MESIMEWLRDLTLIGAISVVFVIIWSIIVVSPKSSAPAALTPGDCECGHMRCCHADGRGKCAVAYPPGEDGFKESTVCACRIYIFDPDGGDDDSEEDPTPSPADLEKLYTSSFKGTGL
jgi:hypothetical protein